MKRISVLLLFAGLLSITYAQDKNSLILINDEPVSVDEFVRVYEKNNPNAEYSDSAIDEYLELYVNFKLKVAEARSLGYDTLPSFVNELKGYRDQLAKPYFKNEEVEEQIIQEAYNRLLKEVNVSHILIKLPKNASPEDTAKAYNKAMEAYNAIQDGTLTFNDAVAKYTEDEHGIAFNGSIGFIRAFVTVYEFEDAAYKAKMGELTKPVRTSFGYHLVLVKEERKSRGELKIAHIFVKSDDNMSEEDRAKAQEKINKIVSYLKDGQEYETIAREYSEDNYTAQRGGEIGWFSAGRMVPQIANAAYKLQVDETSEIVESPYGYHIIKLLDEKPVVPLEEMRAELEKNVKRGARNNKPEQIVIAQLKKENNFTENKELVNKTISALIGSIEKNNFDSILATDLSGALFSLGDKKFTQKEFVSFVKSSIKKTVNTNVGMFASEKYTEFVSNSVKEFEDSMLEAKYPDFKYLIQEYHDGILLFNIMEKKVWNYASEDTIGLKLFFEQNRDQYIWDTRADVATISYTDSSLSDKLVAALNETKTIQFDAEKLMTMVCDEGSNKCLTIESEKYEPGDDAEIDAMDWFEGEYSAPQLAGDKYALYRIVSVLDPVHKELNECRGLVIADYQSELEAIWLEELKQKYDVRINAKLLKKLKKGKY